jgi:hypothetical protein
MPIYYEAGDITRGTLARAEIIKAELEAIEAAFIALGTALSDATIDPTTTKASEAEARAGADNTKWMSPLRVLQALETQRAAAHVDTFTGAGTWTKPTSGGYNFARVRLWGGGGGGGGGMRGATGTNRTGGSGGGGGGFIERIFLLSDLGATESVLIGAGGTGGAGSTTNSTGGGDGTDGGNTSFGSHLTVYGGKKGLKGATSQPSGGDGGGVSSSRQYGINNNSPDVYEGGSGNAGYGSIFGGGGGGIGAMSSGGNGGGGLFSAGGGAGGQGINSSDAVIFSEQTFGGSRTGKGTGGASGTSGANQNGAAGGDWAGGGGGSALAAGTSVGNGGAGGRAAGGGGGSGSTNGTTSGAGGAGGNGYAEITCF